MAVGHPFEFPFVTINDHFRRRMYVVYSSPCNKCRNVANALEKELALKRVFFVDDERESSDPLVYVMNRVRRQNLPRDMALSQRVSLSRVDVGPGRHWCGASCGLVLAVLRIWIIISDTFQGFEAPKVFAAC